MLYVLADVDDNVYRHKAIHRHLRAAINAARASEAALRSIEPLLVVDEAGDITLSSRDRFMEREPQ